MTGLRDAKDNILRRGKPLPLYIPAIARELDGMQLLLDSIDMPVRARAAEMHDDLSNSNYFSGRTPFNPSAAGAMGAMGPMGRGS